MTAEVDKLLDRIESGILYTEALLTPGHMGERDGDWIAVNAAQADSAHRQLRDGLKDLAQIRSVSSVAGLERVESVILYTEATVAPGNMMDRKAGVVKVHAGRAGSSYRQLRMAVNELAEIRVRLGINPAAGQAPGF